MSDSERERTMVHDLLELKSKVDRIITEAFQSNEKFVDMIREAFESVINRKQNKPAELIGKGGITCNLQECMCVQYYY